MPGSALAPPAEPAVAPNVGPYALVAQLGRGGTANVFLALERDDPNARPVVLKVLRAYDEDVDLRRMFANESQIALRLRHPNVIRTFDAGREGDRAYLVMEHLEGRPLSSLLGPAGNAPLPLALRVLVEALEGLHYAHELRDAAGASYDIVHRDVSPHNVFVTYDGDVKVLDFGAAKFADAAAATAIGAIKGRLRYMAPEQAAGQPLDRRADVYSLGLILWQALAGRSLWAGLDDGNVVARLLGGDDPPPPPAPRDGASPGLLEACRRALAHDPARRFESAAAFAAALRPELAAYGERGSRAALAAHLAARFGAERERAERVVDARLRQLTLALTPSVGVLRPRPPDAPRRGLAGALAIALPGAFAALLGALLLVRPRHAPADPPLASPAAPAPSALAPPPPFADLRGTPVAAPPTASASADAPPAAPPARGPANRPGAEPPQRPGRPLPR